VRQRSEGCDSRPLGQKVSENPNKPGMMIHPCNSSYAGGMGRRIVVPGQQGQKAKPYLKKNNLKQKELEVWLKWQNA
jgi:hypothetical protein